LSYEAAIEQLYKGYLDRSPVSDKHIFLNA
jgi:hypothetical protein